LAIVRGVGSGLSGDEPLGDHLVNSFASSNGSLGVTGTTTIHALAAVVLRKLRIPEALSRHRLHSLSAPSTIFASRP